MEQCYFRPFTLCIDSKGVNYENSLPREKEYYLKKNINKNKLKEFLLKPLFAYKKDVKINYNSLYEYIIKKYDQISLIWKKNKNFYDIEQNPFSLRNFGKKINSFIKKMNFKNKDIDLPDRYIFVPFQVEDDSQILFFSDKIKEMNKLVQVVCNNLNKYNNKYNDDLKVVFKTHPNGKDNIVKSENFNNMKNCLLLKKYDTKKLIENSIGVITINSTVGIEALANYKPVITLGKSFYNIENLVLHCNNVDDLYKYINLIINDKINKNLINKFLYHLRFNYCKEIFWRNPDKKSIKRMVDFIDKKF